MPNIDLDADSILPSDGNDATLLGRAWLPQPVAGPSPVLVTAEKVYDLSRVAPTCAQLLNRADALSAARSAVENGTAAVVGNTRELLANSEERKRDSTRPYFLAPTDLQALKACGVTFVSSMLERVIEEQAKGDPQQAEAIRRTIGAEIGASLSAVKPGSPEAARVKQSLVKRGLWSQYLEVGIGPDAEAFTKGQPMAAVGIGAEIGIHPASHWSNPEPEMVMVVNSTGGIVGPRWQLMSTCATSKGATRCFWDAAKTTTLRARSARSFVYSMSTLA